MIAKVGIQRLLSLPVEKFNVIDVGCHAGHFIQFLKPLLDRPSYWIGIDPMECFNSDYDLKYQKAIYDVQKESVSKFNRYVEPGCSSLLKMNTGIITHEREEGKWFVGAQIEKLIEQIEVPVTSLEIILDELGFTEEIHLAKIDAQGADINVVRSLGRYLPKVHLVQIESVSSHDPKLTLYKGQTLMEDDIQEMERLGFTLINTVDHGIVASPEADLIFENANLSS